jgi:hypothetical protein
LSERVSGRFVWPEGVATGLEVPVVSVLLAHPPSMAGRAGGGKRAGRRIGGPHSLPGRRELF